MLIPQSVFCIHALTAGDTRFVNGAIRLERDDKGEPHAIATNGRVLVHVTWVEEGGEHPLRTDPQPGFAALVPAKDWKEAGANLAKVKAHKPTLRCAAVDESLPGGMVPIASTDLERTREIRSRQPDGRYPDWRKLFPKYESPITVRIDPAYLIDVLKAVAEFREEGTKGISITFDGKKPGETPLTIEAQSPTCKARGLVCTMGLRG